MDKAPTSWIGLSALTDEIGSVKISRLIERCGSASAAWEASASEIERLLGIPPETATRVVETRRATDVSRLAETMDEQGIVLICRSDARYPALLNAIPDPPLCLFVRGPAAALATEQIAVVGTRRSTPYGEAATTQIIGPLARAGLTITSGLALGIDGAAHRACLAVGGRTVAVLGTGNDDATIYPARHRRLAQEILAASGSIVTEYPPGTEGRKLHFPARNRIIAGLCIGTLVVECPRTSGALITARFALDFGREVFAVPGPITQASHDGPHAMLKSGATPVTRAEDIIEALHLDALFKPQHPPAVHLTGLPARVANALGHEPIHVDDLSAAVCVPAHELASCLTSLELDGVVRDVGGSRYVKVT